MHIDFSKDALKFDIFNTFGEPGKTVAVIASSILRQLNDKAYVL